MCACASVRIELCTSYYLQREERTEEEEEELNKKNIYICISRKVNFFCQNSASQLQTCCAWFAFVHCCSQQVSSMARSKIKDGGRMQCSIKFIRGVSWIPITMGSVI